MAKTSFDTRCAEAIETIADAMQGISEATKAIQGAQKELNDNFLLHQERSEKAHELLCAELKGAKGEIHGIREDFKATVYPILKWMAAAIIIIAGGAEALKILGVV